MELRESIKKEKEKGKKENITDFLQRELEKQKNFLPLKFNLSGKIITRLILASLFFPADLEKIRAQELIEGTPSSISSIQEKGQEPTYKLIQEQQEQEREREQKEIPEEEKEKILLTGKEYLDMLFKVYGFDFAEQKNIRNTLIENYLEKNCPGTDHLMPGFSSYVEQDKYIEKERRKNSNMNFALFLKSILLQFKHLLILPEEDKNIKKIKNIKVPPISIESLFSERLPQIFNIGDKELFNHILIVHFSRFPDSNDFNFFKEIPVKEIISDNYFSSSPYDERIEELNSLLKKNENKKDRFDFSNLYHDINLYDDLLKKGYINQATSFYDVFDYSMFDDEEKYKKLKEGCEKLIDEYKISKQEYFGEVLKIKRFSEEILKIIEEKGGDVNKAKELTIDNFLDNFLSKLSIESPQK